MSRPTFCSALKSIGHSLFKAQHRTMTSIVSEGIFAQYPRGSGLLVVATLKIRPNMSGGDPCDLIKSPQRRS